MGNTENSKKLKARVIQTQYNINKANISLDRALATSLTKESMRKHIGTAKDFITKENLDGYRNTLEKPFTPMQEGNTIADELQGIKEDIGTILYLIAKEELREAEKMLIDIQNRI